MFDACGVQFKSWRQLYRALGMTGNVAPIKDPIKLKAWLLVKLEASDDQELLQRLASLSAELNQTIVLMPNDKALLKAMIEGAQIGDLEAATGLDRNAVIAARAHLMALCESA